MSMVVSQFSPAEGLDSVIDAERFEARLRSLALLPPEDKRKRFNALFSNEKRRIKDHEEMNVYIEEKRAFNDEIERENQDWEGE